MELASNTLQMLVELRANLSSPLAYRIMISKLLPFPETVPACDVQTRCEVRVLSGREINVIFDKKNRIIYVSEYLFERYKNYLQEVSIKKTD